jgi:tetratricopeptide (TPR) repeat protein
MPARKSPSAVEVRDEFILLPTYLPLPPERSPIYFERRVYQGSSGSIYPLPFTERVSEEPVERRWRAVWIENDYLKVLLLPEIGGRIHAIQDKTNGFDLVHRQAVIKPALVGLAGPWASGGIEFNWPQHHRPATFLPTEVHIEEAADGSKTVWCGDHDPLQRMKAMHGVCLRPGIARVELRVRAYNRTPIPQTFLWWANVAIRVHEGYQSFFPPDVHSIADHAKRATSSFPLCGGRYYGVDYSARARDGVPAREAPANYVPPASGGKAPVSYPANDLSFYANIPVPTSYMAMGSVEDFFGGYDHFAEAGVVHIADHHIAPGKKQWTWGNHSFGYAWDRNLTDANASGEHEPYIELMAGVYTDNQPDFSFLQPGETKTWIQYWAPITRIGPPRHANANAALALQLDGRKARIGVSVFARHPRAVVELLVRGSVSASFRRDLAPAASLVETVAVPPRTSLTDLRLVVRRADGEVLIEHQPCPIGDRTLPHPATEPPAPCDIASCDELYVTGLHLDQYRHATRLPEPYWREALRRDPGDCRCNTALAWWHLRRGEFARAEAHARAAIARQTLRNPNPGDGEAHYTLGLVLVHLERVGEARAAFSKAAWNQAWTAASRHALAELDCRAARWTEAHEHLSRALRLDTDNLRASALLVMVLRKLDRKSEAEALLAANHQLDPLDLWSRHLRGETQFPDGQACMDLAHDLARAGFLDDAIAVLRNAPSASGDLPDQSWGAAPLLAYTLGAFHFRAGRITEARAAFKRAAALPADYCFPARVEEIAILRIAMRTNPSDARAPYYLGNLLYHRRRYEEAVACWKKAARLDPTFAVVWRNLGIASFNALKRPDLARRSYARACRLAPDDARLFYERDQLDIRLGISPARRLRNLERRRDLVESRDDLSLELASLYNQTGRPDRARKLLDARRFMPWEGGEGQKLAQHARAEVLLGRASLARGEHAAAIAHFEHARTAPENLGEARHLLANQSELLFWLGEAHAAAGDRSRAREAWHAAATFKGDFQDMSVRAFSELTFFSALSLSRLGDKPGAQTLLRELLAYARALEKSPARIDYFATSLPSPVLDEDLQARQLLSSLLMQAQAMAGLGRIREARIRLAQIFRLTPNHPQAADLDAMLAGNRH